MKSAEIIRGGAIKDEELKESDKYFNTAEAGLVK
jgi:nucleosome assembly protein 1-like 1